MTARHLAAKRGNPDRVTPPVVVGGALGAVAAGLARALIDRYVDPADAELAWSAFQTVVVPVLPAVGAWLGGLWARRDVTPVTRDATPRNLEGEELLTAEQWRVRHERHGTRHVRRPAREDRPGTIP